MLMKEHPFLVTTTFQGDGVTIKYDEKAENRSDAVGRAFKINGDGEGELVSDGDEIIGKVLAVDDDNQFTAACMFGGLRFPIGDGATVAVGDQVVGALGADGEKGHVKSLPALTLPSDLTAAAGNPTQSEHNAIVTAFNELKAEVETLSESNGRGRVLAVDATHVFVVFPG